MSQENVEVIVRSIYSKWQRGNFADVHFDPEVVFESVMPDSSERVVAHGPEGVEAFMRESSRSGATIECPAGTSGR